MKFISKKTKKEHLIMLYQLFFLLELFKLKYKISEIEKKQSRRTDKKN